MSAPLLAANFLVVPVNLSYQKAHNYDTANRDLATRYAVPLEKGIPALTVLGEDGKLIFSQQKGEFEDMRHLHSSDLTAFLERWKALAPVPEVAPGRHKTRAPAPNSRNGQIAVP